jgi:hypothetical protein
MPHFAIRLVDCPEEVPKARRVIDGICPFEAAAQGREVTGGEEADSDDALVLGALSFWQADLPT